MDFWDLLDFPRRRLQRYPLLTKTILSHTPADIPEHTTLTEAISLMEQAIVEVDKFCIASSRGSLVDFQATLDFSHSEPVGEKGVNALFLYK